nr:clavaminate synthase-like protein At3g21360 [Ipomoea batatas]
MEETLGSPLPARRRPRSGAIKEQKPWIDALLHQSGAILFKGFPVNSTFDFNDVVEAFGYKELPYGEGGTPRTNALVVLLILPLNFSVVLPKFTFNGANRTYSLQSTRHYGLWASESLSILSTVK